MKKFLLVLVYGMVCAMLPPIEARAQFFRFRNNGWAAGPAGSGCPNCVAPSAQRQQGVVQKIEPKVSVAPMPRLEGNLSGPKREPEGNLSGGKIVGQFDPSHPTFSPTELSQPIDEYLSPGEKDMLARTNSLRAQHGLKPLAFDLNRQRVARQWGYHMLSSYHHSNNFGRAENIASGQQNAAVVVNDWYHSPGHRRNMLNPSFTKCGMAGYIRPNGSCVWVQQFE